GLRLGIMANGTNAFRSNLDDTRLYNRVLSASEIAALAGSAPNLQFTIMPLGNSMTSDDYSGDTRPVGLRPGYRQNLYLALQEYGYTINFTGSKSSGFDALPDFDADHEGHPGYTAAQVADSVYHWLTLHPAGNILLEIGTNGLQSSTVDVEDILNQIDLFEQNSNIQIKVVVAQIPNRVTYSSLTTTFNNNLAIMVTNRVAAGDKLFLIDLENDAGLNYLLEPSGDMRDDIHPNQNGYNKIAALWFDSLIRVLSPVTAKVPVSPTGLSAVAQSGQSIILSWNDGSYIETGYSVERTVTGSGSYSVIATLAENSTNYNDNSVSNGISYTYRVRAFNAIGYSGYSNTDEATANGGDPLAAGLIAHYTFENSAVDVSGNAHNGTLLNGAAFSTLVKEGNYSLMLDGVDDYVDLGIINLGQQFTFASWVYIPTGSSNIRTLIANTSSGSTRNGFKITVNEYATTDRKIIFETGNGTTSGYALSPVSTFGFDTWNHVAVTADLTTGQAKIYYNGADVTASSSIVTNFITNAVIRLGIMTNSAFPMRSNLDDTRLYSRVLSPAEVSSLTTLPGLKSAGNAETISADADYGLKIYPNPFRDEINISSDKLISSIEVYNLIGNKIYEKRSLNTTSFRIEKLGDSYSLFVIKIYFEDGHYQTVKLMKIR
ncbi:MAG TPA: LamG-like jellyroll fold domain-containing protein, partial [Bacteroidales bacterium]|nr:LamG-like jellyroll fold domain-containing protein [Bacteroidales bacterium]